MQEKNRKRIQGDLIKRVSELEALLAKNKQSEEILRYALKQTYDDLEGRIEERTSVLMSANKQLREEVDERKKIEDALHYRAELERLITTLSTNFIKLSPLDTDAAIKRALQKVGEFVGVDRMYVFLFSEKGMKVDETYEWCAEGVEPQIINLRGRSIEEEFPWFAKKAKKQGILHISSCSELPPEAVAEKGYFQRYNIQSFIAVPIFCGKSFFGFVGFDSIQKKKEWAVDIIALLRIVGEIFANALERQSMEDAVRKSEDRYRLLFECSSDGIAVLDKEGIIIDCNDTYTEHVKCPRRHILGKRPTEFIEQGYKDAFQKAFANLKKNGREETEFAIIRRDGARLPVRCKVTLVCDETGAFNGALLHCRDISDLKQHEELLHKAFLDMEREQSDSLLEMKTQLEKEIADRRETEDALQLAYTELNQIFNTAADGMGIIDKDFNLYQINRTFTRLFGKEQESMKGKKCYELLPSQLCHTEDCPLIQILNGTERIERKVEIDLKDGGKIPCILTATPFRCSKGELIGIIEDFKDIGEYRKALEDLKKQVIRDETLLDISVDGFYVTDQQGRLIEANQAFSDLTGYLKEELLSMKISDIVLNDSLKVADSVKSGKFEDKYRHKNGMTLYVEVAATPLSIDDENLFLFSVRDTKQMDDMARHLKIFASVIEEETQGIALIDLNGRVLYANSAYATIHDQTPDEIIGKPLTYFHTAQQLQFLGINGDYIHEQAGYTGEIWYSRNDGRAFPARISKKIIHDAKGKPVSTIIKIKELKEKGQLDEGAGKKGEWEKIALFSQSKRSPCIDGGGYKEGDEQVCAGQDQVSSVPIHKKGGKKGGHEYSFIKNMSKEIGFTQGTCFQNILSRSQKMWKIFEILPSIAESISTVMLQGESGTGKHLFATAIHDLSPRKKKPFITINCGALPDTLLESELFGYKAGAFTDAKKDKPGRFALANGGTLFLDEIGDISPAMQVRLLRFLQERVYEPLGSVNSLKSDVRIITATNKNLTDLVKEGRFREDLFYRINVVRLDLPPLRERLEDVPLLVEHFISLLKAQQGKEVTGVTDEALIYLLSYDYPGNIRELENIIEQSFVLCHSGMISPEHLPESICASRGIDFSDEPDISPFMKMEAAFLINVLRQNKWNRLETARQLGIHKATLFRKIKSLGLNIPSSKGRSDS